MITTSQLALILDEYVRRYAEHPERFMPLLDEQGQAREGYGQACARHMAEIAADLGLDDGQGKPLIQDF